MNILSKSTKNGIIRIKTDKPLFEITLDEKIELSRKYRANWYGASYENKISTLMLKLR